MIVYDSVYILTSCCQVRSAQIGDVGRSADCHDHVFPKVGYLPLTDPDMTTVIKL